MYLKSYYTKSGLLILLIILINVIDFNFNCFLVVHSQRYNCRPPTFHLLFTFISRFNIYIELFFNVEFLVQ